MEQKDLSQNSQEKETTPSFSNNAVVNKPIGIVAPQKRNVAVTNPVIIDGPVNQINQQYPTSNPVQSQNSEGQSRPQQNTQNNDLPTNAQPLNRTWLSDLEKRRLIQQQLMVILHARNCPINEDQTMCTFPHCRTMKNVLDHMVTCDVGVNCTVPHCSSSRKITGHWRYCVRTDCPLCSPVRLLEENWNLNNNNDTSTVNNQQQLPGNSNEASQDSSSLVNALIRSSDSHVSMRIQGTQEWQLSITSDLRAHIVQKLVIAIFPNPSAEACLDRRMKNLISFAKKIEGDMYEMATTKMEYFRLIAEKIHKLQKELEEKRQRHRIQQQMRVQQQAVLKATNLAASLKKVTKPIGAVKPIRRNFHANGTRMNLTSMWVQQTRRFHDMTRNDRRSARNESLETTAQSTEMDQTNTPLEQTLPESGPSTAPNESISSSINDNIQSSTSTSNAHPALSEEQKSSIKRSIQSMVHALKCNEVNCEVGNCSKMKRLLQHMRTCRRRPSGGCQICKQLVALCCFHARQCQDTSCPMSACSIIKQKLGLLNNRGRRLESLRLFGSKSIVFKNRRWPS